MSSNILNLRSTYEKEYGFKTSTKSSFEVDKGLSEATIKEML